MNIDFAELKKLNNDTLKEILRIIDHNHKEHNKFDLRCQFIIQHGDVFSYFGENGISILTWKYEVNMEIDRRLELKKPIPTFDELFSKA